MVRTLVGAVLCARQQMAGRGHNRILISAGVLIVVGGLCVAAGLLAGSDGGFGSKAATPPDNNADFAQRAASAPQLLEPDGQLQDALRGAATVSEKLSALDRYGRVPGASSRCVPLRHAMSIERSGAVRIKAFQVAKELASREGSLYLTEILRSGITNPHEDVRREGLRACRDNPRYELLTDLLGIVKSGGSERPVAIQALAFMDDPVAQQAVLDTAMADYIPREQRVQAVALLCRTRLNDGVAYMQQLATGDDDELRDVAMVALRVWQDSQRR